MKLGCTSLKLTQNIALKGLLGHKPVYVRFIGASQCHLLGGWGYGEYSQSAQELARAHKKPFIYLEDGFLRSPFSSGHSQQAYSIVSDNIAPYYDYTKRTDLEKLICESDLDETRHLQATEAIKLFKEYGLSKYAVTTDTTTIPDGFRHGSILIIDQLSGDLSLQYGGVNDAIIKQLYQDVKTQYPDQKIFLKLHPEVQKGLKTGCFDFIHAEKNVICITDTDLPDLLKLQPKVFALTSLAGFEAVIHGCEVTIYGLPWYAGYGLTEDKHSVAYELSQRRKKVSLEHLFWCAYFSYTHYFDPISGNRIDFFKVAYLFGRIKQHIKMMSGTILCLGIRPWKKKTFYPWVKTHFNHIDYINNVSQMKKALADHQDKQVKIIVWGYNKQDLIDYIQENNPHLPIIRVEDGFIRSYGLGSDFFAPYSLNFDQNGIYYNNQAIDKPNDLRCLMEQAPFNQFQRERAILLSKKIIQNQITKYNLDYPNHAPLSLPKKKQIIFVPGQVQGDASLKYGSLPENIRDDFDLLKKVRTDYPDAHIIYKPHPDVVAKNRKGGGENLDKLCDQIEIKTSSLMLIEKADLVITMTSQVGFDAILRNKDVIAYGKPFYKGYGLCADEIKKDVSLGDLIYATLIAYPLYMIDKNYVMVDNAIDKIINEKCLVDKPYKNILLRSSLLRYLYKIKKWIIG